MSKKIIIALLLTLLTFSIVSCGKKEAETNTSTLTLDTVLKLSKKGDALSWEDFNKYESKEIGSGLLILRYDIDDKYYLLIGGGNENEKPMYIYLVRKNNTDDYVDIRMEDVEGFIDRD